MGSNLNVLRNLLLTCPNCSWEEIFSICKIADNKQFASQLVKLYEHEIDNDEKLGYQEPDVNLDENEYFDSLVNYIKQLNNYVETNNLFFRNYKFVDNICRHLDNVITAHFEFRISEAPKNVTQKSRIETIENLKQNKDTSDIVDALVFEIRDILFFKKAFIKYFLTFNQYFKQPSNITSLVEKYIDIAKDVNVEDYTLISISKIICYIINNQTIELSTKEREKNLNILNTTISKLSTSNYGEYERKRIIKSLNILVDYIKDVKPSSKRQFETNINEKYGIKPSFSEQALKELSNLKKVNDKFYIDLTNKYVITIDEGKKTCSEDAMSVEVLPNGNYLLGIYITDVYSYIKNNSILELEAYNRAKTIYIPNKPITMFPDELVYNQFSLKANQKKYVMANLFELSPTFDLINHEIKRAIIKPKVNKSYSEIKYDVEHGRDATTSKMYEKLLSLSDSIKQTNPILKKHYNNQTNYKNQNDIIALLKDIVANLMIYLNYNVQQNYEKLDLPCIYKIYCMNNGLENNNKIEKIKPLVDFVIDNLKEPSYKSFYSAKKTGHTGANLCISMPTTIPVRNYAALQNQKLVQKYFIDKQKIKDKEMHMLEEQLDITSNYLNEKNKIINEYLEEYRYGMKRYKK